MCLCRPLAYPTIPQAVRMLAAHHDEEVGVQRSRRVGLGILVACVLTVVTQVALAASVPIADVDLEGSDALWDPIADYDYGAGIGGPCTSSGSGFSAVEGGEYDGMSDAFDGGLYLKVGSTLFDDADLQGNLQGQRLTVGPTQIGGLRVTRIEEALQTSPTLRSLVKLTNTSNGDVTTTLTWDSGMGADGDERTRSSNAKPFRAATGDDDWIVASDNADDESLSDPPITFVMYGDGDLRVKGRTVPIPPEADDPDSGEGCVVFRFRVTVPEGQTRYVMFFTELRLTNTKAIASAKRFGRVKLGSALMDGITPKVARRILNWDLS
jgi:hypothetical protein